MIKGITSAATIVELNVVVKRDISKDEGEQVLERVRSVKNLDIISLDFDILERAFELQKQYGLGIFDSLHASACYLRDENREIISTDKALDGVEGINRIDLRDY